MSFLTLCEQATFQLMLPTCQDMPSHKGVSHYITKYVRLTLWNTNAAWHYSPSQGKNQA